MAQATTPDEKSALVLFAHGSRDPLWADPFRAIQNQLRERQPKLTVELAFLEIMEPSLTDAAARLAASGYTRLTIAPLFMAQGAHLKRDLAGIMTLLRERHVHTQFVVLPALGEVDEVRESIGAWIGRHA